MSQEWNPFQYGPNGTDLSRWEWTDPPGKPSHKHLVDQNDQVLASVTWETALNGQLGWRTTARHEAARWISGTDDDTESRELSPLWAQMEDAMEQAETTVSEAGIAAGAVPSPSEVPAIFMIGHIVTGDVMLREIEKTLRTHFGRDYRPGTIIHFQSDAEDQRMPANPVLQAKATATVFNMDTGRYLPSWTRPPDEVLYDACRQAVERLAELLGLLECQESDDEGPAD